MVSAENPHRGAICTAALAAAQAPSWALWAGEILRI